MAELNGIKIKYRRADAHLFEEQLKEIADLIYDSDPYIYPAMFTDRREATRRFMKNAAGKRSILTGL